MKPLFVTSRTTCKPEEERVYGQKAIALLYGGSWWGRWLAHFAARLPFVSAFYGWLQKKEGSKKKILPFIQLFQIDTSDFLEPPTAFNSFNEFFTRKLKPEARPITPGANIAVCPADGRYRFIPHIGKSEGFIVKGEKFDLELLLNDPVLAARYSEGAMMMARLCPSDYHRFHFPVACIPSPAKLINGWLYSVNPAALIQDIHIFTKNKRALTTLQTENFGQVLYVEIGATNVGSIQQTFQPNQKTAKGAEKGYFEFGASALIILFEKDKLQFDSQLLELQKSGLEIKCLMGQTLGRGNYENI